MVDTAITAAYNPTDRKLEPQSIGEQVLYALTQPKHVNVNEITCILYKNVFEVWDIGI